jgi:Flp pilus assembly protein TadG
VRWQPAETGSVTAEFAMVLPAVVLVLAMCLGAVQVTGQQVRMTDAAASAARSLARGDGHGPATAIARQAAGSVTLASESRGQFVCAHLSAPSEFLPFAAAGLQLEVSSCALAGGL